MSTLRKALLIVSLAAFCGLPLAAQLTDCAFTRTFTGDLNAASSSNISGNTPCVNWRITYSVSPPPDNLTSTVTFQTSPDNTNWTAVPNTICSTTVQPPCILQGTNPLTGTTQGMSLFAAYGSYVRVITSGSAGTGTGTIRGYGSKGATASSSGAGGGGGVTIPLTTNLLAGNGSGGVSDGGVTPTTSVGTPGVDTKVPTEKAVRTALALLVPYVGATANVDLAAFDLLTGAGNGGFGTDLRTGNVAPHSKVSIWGGNVSVADPAVLGSESLTNGALTSGTSWTTTGDFALAANAATYTHSAGSGTLQQTTAVLAIAGFQSRWYKFVYTVSAVTAGMTQCGITSTFADTTFGTSFDITAGVAKVFYFQSATTPANFIISCTSTAGGLTLDDLSLTEVQGGNVSILGNVNIGRRGSTAPLSVTGISTANNGQVIIADSAQMAQDVGGTISFGFKFNASGFATPAEIHAGKENGTSSNYAGYLAFFTAPNGGTNTERMRIDSAGQIGIGITAPIYSLDVSKGVGLTGTARFFDQTATTGATLVTITPGAAQTAASKVLDVGGNIRLGSTNSTAVVAGVIGTTCPAITCTAAYTWVQAISSDNSVVYFPVWK